jgi:uncharacterized protein (TIGR02001 family)
MFKKTVIAGLTAAALAPAFAQAQTAPAPAPAAAPEPASPHTLTGNFGLFSQYIFRGLTQTDRQPAAQGGFDYSHESGFYVGTWASNISWLRDFNSYKSGGSLEWDIYGGYKGTFGKSDFGYDVGLLYYWYPGDVASGGTKADTTEVYGALSWKWLSGKFSYSVDTKTFGVSDSRGTYYFDLTANYPITEKLTGVVHYGIQKYKGNSSSGVSNDSLFSYDDYKIGLSYSLPKDFTVGVFYTNTTSMSSTQKTSYTTSTANGGRFIGDGTGTVFIQKTF